MTRADHPERIEYILTVHASRWKACNAQEVSWYRAENPEDYLPGAEPDLGTVPAWGMPWHAFNRVKNDKRDCVVDQTNAAAEASHGKILCGVADDYFPPEHWDTLLLEAILGYPIEEFTGSDPKLNEPIIVHCATGASVERDRELMIGGAWTRPVYDLYGYILDADFESMFADNWYAFCARRDAAAGLLTIIERLDIQFDHRHPVFNKGQMDGVYALENRPEAYYTGHLLFQQKVSGSRIMVMCLPGESFDSNLVASRFQLTEDVKMRTRYGMVAPHWAYTTNVYQTRIELTKSALAFPSCTKEEDLVLMCDDDNPLDFPQLQILMQDLDEHPDLSGVVAWCWCGHNEDDDGEARKWVMSCGRQDVEDLTCLRFAPEDFDRAIERGNCLISSDDVQPHAFWSGLPILLIRRSALVTLGWRSFVARTADPTLVNALLLAKGQVHGEALEAVMDALKWAEVLDSIPIGMTSEDTSFFFRAHELGLKFAVDIRVRVPHLKLRGIKPQYVPEREREQVEDIEGRRFGQPSGVAAAD
jgi:hypothetical protein